jgi:peroxiredoxin
MFKSKLASVLGLTLALGAMAAFGAGDDVKPAKIGDKAPAFSLKNLDGKEVSLKDYAGKIVVLEWVNPQCPVCKGAHMDGRIPGMIKDLRAMDGVVHLAINSTATTTADENKEALKRYGIEYTVLLDNDGKVGHAYGATNTPHMFVIDTKGVLRYQGALDNGGPQGKPKDGEKLTNYALNAVKQIKANDTVSPDSTKAYGCNVKYKN